MISIIIPVYNQKNEMEYAVKKLLNKSNNYEIIIAEDGSVDGSYELAKKLARKKNVKLSHESLRRGKGHAIKRSLDFCKGEKIIFMDVDLSTNLNCLDEMIEALDKYDIVIGSRRLKDSKVKWSLKRKVLSFVFNTLVRFMFQTGIKDHQCGFKGFNRKLIPFIKNVEEDGFLFDTELIIKAKKKYKIKEIPIEWEEKKGTFNIITDSLSMFIGLIRLKIKNSILKKGSKYRDS